MYFSRVVDRWEEWQLRILVLGSLAVQLHLAFFAPYRKWPNLMAPFRLLIWVSYVGGDALAIYALATLFNRQKKLQYRSSSVNDGGSHDLEVLWAPILLIHLGGRMTISAYNIEDNELWMRHMGTAASQVAVTLYVFCTSWSPSADKRLLAAAVVLFILGIFRCFEKPFALRRASFKALLSYFRSASRTAISANREVELEKYIQDARAIVVQRSSNRQHMEQAEKLSYMENLSMPDKLFVDYTYAYSDRLDKQKFLCLLDSQDTYEVLREGLSRTFNLIYTKLWQSSDENRDSSYWATFFSTVLWNITLAFPIAPIILFHISHKQAYRGSDITVTYLLLYITYFSEIISVPTRLVFHFRGWTNTSSSFLKYCATLIFQAPERLNSKLIGSTSFLPPILACQHNLVRVLAHERRCKILTSCLAKGPKCCQDLLQQHWFGRSYFDFDGLDYPIELVRAHAIDGWMNYIKDIETYWKFSDSRGHWTLERHACQEKILWDSLEKPLDEAIILWHLATDFCLAYPEDPHVARRGSARNARTSYVVSNYMMYLLSSNTEMLLPGSRISLFKLACRELDDIRILQGDDDDVSQCTCYFCKKKPLTEKIMNKAEQSQDGFLHDAWVLTQGLVQLGGSGDGGWKKMWEVIRGVWIEMLCFSAGRCRGYLHAKGLAYGGEFLTVVSLMMSHAGLETFSERQQRVQLRLPRDERVRRAKWIIEEAALSAATPSTDSATSQSQGESTAAPATEAVGVQEV